MLRTPLMRPYDPYVTSAPCRVGWRWVLVVLSVAALGVLSVLCGGRCGAWGLRSLANKSVEKGALGCWREKRNDYEANSLNSIGLVFPSWGSSGIRRQTATQ